MHPSTSRILAATLWAIGLTALTGCGLWKSRTTEPTAPPAAEKRSGLTPVHDGTFRVPSIESLVNEHGIQVKVVVVQPGVRCLDAVPTGTVTGSALHYFRPYFVFDVFPRQGATQFYQVGATPRRDSVLGWAPAAGVVRWDTRVGARYCRTEGTRVPPLLVYREQQSLIDLLKDGSTKAEPIARAAWKANRTQMPWPITETAQATVDGQVHELVRLNFLGEFRSDALPGPQPAYSPQEVQRIQAGIKMLDLVFVLDVTGSMAPYLDAARETVRDITRRVRALEYQPDVALGLVAFRDYDKESGFVTRHFDLERDHGRFLQQIDNLTAAAGGDIPEAVYDGVYDALEKTAWRGQGLSTRVLVLIGDASAHEPGDPQNPRNISRDRLVEMAKQRHVKLFALAVGGPEKTADQVLMKQQFSDLARRGGGDCFPIENAGAVVQRVGTILRQASAVVQQRAVVVEDLTQGHTPAQIAAARDLDIHQVTEVLELLQGAGIDVRRLGKNMPTFASGWALCEWKGTPILEREVHVARAELDVLLAALNLLCSKLSPDFGRQAFGLGVGGRVNPLASFFDGDVPEPLDVFLMAKGVPVGRLSLLRLTAAEVQHMPEERRATLRERIARTVVPALQNARNDDVFWTYRDDLEYGWIPERLLP